MNRKDVVDSLRKVIEYLEQPEEAPHRKGYCFERRFCELCEYRQLSCVRSSPGHCDYLVNGLRVQCKKLTPDQYGRVSIQAGIGGNYPIDSFDVLAVEIDSNLCLVPSQDMPTTEGTAIKSSLAVGFILKYVDAWWVIERAARPTGFVRQLTLLNEEATHGR